MVRRVGVEEELLLIEPETGRPQAVAGTVLRGARQTPAGAAAQDAAQALDYELQLQQLETNTQPCRTLDELGGEIRRCRALAAGAAARAGVQVAALATSPVPVEPQVVANSRYQAASLARSGTQHAPHLAACSAASGRRSPACTL